ncbi:sporulation integral membrane protein YlbJ [Bacillus pakistanensis]|uniref:Sporulation integral membrane protein YlbJ n=1 Tax=Rossellomorea pakistanensis TaxID=992288 RepID=A0ABS2NFT7_9BACI|nr:sporulation integral membrane protein YlbJ [Bacillus pakistanensis]MBM7586716.1 sporulation integral membrane protein YlbJ [Bacillus pakistanensis]
MNASKIKTLLLSLSVSTFALSLIIFPEESFEASIRGLNMWWEIVFPSLLPFFIISEMLIGIGVVRFIGVLLEPLMRPIFRVPGVGGFVWAMGMASGFPAGAKLSARLRQEKQLTRIEAERLVSFTNSSNPLFIFGAVSVGFFKNPHLGVILALAHYLGNICVGIIMRFYGRKEEKQERTYSMDRSFSIKTALSVLHQTRLKDKRPLGKLLGDAVSSSIQTLLMIGGFIILFSVLNKILFHLHITPLIASGLTTIFIVFGLSESLTMPFISGLFEITLGSQMTSGIDGTLLIHQALITSFILGFNGFSVQAQAASIMAQTDIRFKPFFYARILHGMIAATISVLLWKPVYERFYHNQPSNAVPVFNIHQWEFWGSAIYWLKAFGPILTIISLGVYCLLLWRKIVDQNRLN